jgi:hypothetical protein
MTNSERDKQFFEMADKFIELANQQSDGVANGKVALSMLFAVARFNAYVYAGMSGELEQFQKERQVALDYFTSQFRAALEENLNDYEKNFSEYTSKS